MEVNVNPEEESVTPIEEVSNANDYSTTTDDSTNVNIVVVPPEPDEEEEPKEHTHPEIEAKLDAILDRLDKPEPETTDVVDETVEESHEEESESQFEPPTPKRRSWLYGNEV